jgi:hypothetical protein
MKRENKSLCARSAEWKPCGRQTARSGDNITIYEELRLSNEEEDNGLERAIERTEMPAGKLKKNVNLKQEMDLPYAEKFEKMLALEEFWLAKNISLHDFENCPLHRMYLEVYEISEHVSTLHKILHFIKMKFYFIQEIKHFLNYEIMEFRFKNREVRSI